MNNHEFRTLGVLLFGNTWKTELAGALNISPKSNTVARISRGETGVSNETKNNLITFLEKKSILLSSIAEYLKAKTIIPIEFCKNQVITFDEDGIKEWCGLENMVLNNGGFYLNNAKIISGYSNEVFFNSMIISSMYSDDNEKNKELIINFIKDKFDLRLIGGDKVINCN